MSESEQLTDNFFDINKLKKYSLFQTTKGVIVIVLLALFFLFILALIIGRYSMFDNNVNYGPILLNRIYQGFPLS